MIRNLTEWVFTLKEGAAASLLLLRTGHHISYQVSNNKLHLGSVLGKPITMLVGKQAVLEILIEVLKS